MDHYNLAHRVIDGLQEGLFPRLESCRDKVNAQAIEGTIDEQIKLVESYIEKMEIALNKAAPAQRSTIKFKLDQLRYDHKHILNSFRVLLQRRLAREREAQEREELLTRRFTTNAEANSAGGLGDTQISMPQMEYYDNEKSKLNGFSHNLDEMLATGGAVLNSLRDQRQMLNGVHRRLIDAASTLGLSNSVMRLIEKRAFMDKVILFGGMLVLTLIMFLVWKYLT